jgi:hypothetical protein
MTRDLNVSGRRDSQVGRRSVTHDGDPEPPRIVIADQPW